MKELLRTSLTLAALAASIPCQIREATPKERLDYAAVVETSEGRLDHAEQLYRGLLADARAKDVHEDTALRLGRLLWTLDRRDEARPLLERATRSGGERAEQAKALLESGNQDRQQDREREQKAEALVIRMAEILSRYANDQKLSREDERRLQALRTEVLWLGDPAARVVARQLAVDDSIAREDWRLRNLSPKLSYFYELLWSIGGEPARAFLLKTAASGPLPLVRFASANASARGKGMADVFAAFARSNDPTGETWRNLRRVAHDLGPQDVLALAGNENADARALAMNAATNNWQRYSEVEREVFFSMHHQRIRAALASPVASQRTAAQTLLMTLLAFGPQGGTELFFEVATTLPANFNFYFPGGPGNEFRVEADDAWIHRAAQTASQLGRLPRREPQSPPVGPAAGLSGMLDRMQVAWTDAARDDVVTLVELGYFQKQTSWLEDIYRQASPAQAARVIRSLPEQRDPRQALNVLRQREPHPSWFEACRAAVQQCFEDPSVSWRGTLHDGRIHWRPEVLELLRLGGVAAPDRAAPWIGAIAAARPQLLPHCIGVLVELSQQDHAAARDQLRDLLERFHAKLDGNTADRLFQELVRAGDEAAIPLLAAHYDIDWSDSASTVQGTATTRANRGGARTNRGTRRIDYLCTGEVGYPFDAQVRLWQALVAGPHADKVWFDLLHGNGGDGARVPTAGLPALTTLLLANSTERPKDQPENRYTLVTSFRALDAEELQRHPRLESCVSRLASTSDARLWLGVLSQLPAEVARRYAEAGKRALRANPRIGNIERLMQRLEFDRDLWLLLLQENTYSTLKAMPDARVVELETQVAALLADDRSGTRSGAAQALVRALGSRAAAYLLPLLRDDDTYVRKYAKNTLDDLRAIRQQEDFWGDASRRIDTTPASAAAKLIAQAMPDQDKAQRLLAIRSLALLGEPAALPYLIDWTTDDDREVQKAARAAITQLHGAGKLGGEAGGGDKK
ncbi:MAG: HEAT repeat domain-containing protein [Planctomycetota bacterium]